MNLVYIFIVIQDDMTVVDGININLIELSF